MAGFSGFTEEEIKRFKSQGESNSFERNTRQEPAKKATLNSTGKRSKPREKVRSKSKTNGSVLKDVAAEKTAEVLKVNVETKHEEKQEEKPREVEVVMEAERVKELEMSNIEKMQQKQKEMEMINKKKEKLLHTALKQRYAKTKKEAETLKLVQKELNRLDNLLYTDVQILRDKIDHACRDFDAARKRYDRAEAEFINAKVDLHDKTETKDQLTEHLCSIIQQNEERKAKKLAELMARLEMADQETDLENISQGLEEESTVVHSTSLAEDNVNTTEKKACEAGEKNNIIDENSPVKSSTTNISEAHKKTIPSSSSMIPDTQNNNENSENKQTEAKTADLTNEMREGVGNT